MMSQTLLQTYIGDHIDSRENANRYMSTSGFFYHVMKQMLYREALHEMPARYMILHNEGDLYIHKLPESLWIPYCTGHSIRRLLIDGLEVETVSARPAKHLDVYVDHIVNYLTAAQQYFSGAQAYSAVELYAGPYIRREPDKLRQSVQRLIYNLNFPSRAGMQTPFTNLTIALDAGKAILEKNTAIYGGEDTGEPLATYIDEAKKFVLELAKELYRGDRYGQPFTFPIPTLMTTAKSIWEDPELHEWIFKTAAKRGSFYWLNTRVVDPDASYCMCCRLNLSKKELEYAYNGKINRLVRLRFGGIWAMPDVTGSINVVTINLPRLVAEAKEKGDIDKYFWELYTETLNKARAILDWQRARYIKLINSYPEMYSIIHKYLIPEGFPMTHFNTVGIIGLPEAAAIYMQEPRLWHEGSNSEWRRAALLMRRIVQYATRTARQWMKETGIPYNIEEVPGETAAAKLAIKDARRYEWITEYLPEPENPIYSTSIAPYYGALDLVDRIEIEAMVQKYFTGGVMMHIFIGEEPEPEALAKLTKKLTQTDLVYWSYTPAVTVCRSCGKTFTGLYNVCPRCGSKKVEVWSRIIGYYRPLRNWNPYRRKEFWSRKHYGV